VRKTELTFKAKPTTFDRWLLRGAGNRKPSPITLPRIRALETPEPNEKGDPEGLPKEALARATSKA
jgi:hypothetical protein